MRATKTRLAISAILLVFGLSSSGTRAQNNEVSPHNGDPDERALVGFKIAPVPQRRCSAWAREVLVVLARTA
jgi:hypothetical protein